MTPFRPCATGRKVRTARTDKEVLYMGLFFRTFVELLCCNLLLGTLHGSMSLECSMILSP